VTVTVTGAEQPLPPEVGQAAYRIVQEALTNVSRHAEGACATVLLRYSPRTLSIQVDNDGAGAAAGSGSGLGLIGMRERVSALGGRLQAGPQDNGGFQVHAEIPLRAAS
jgi:signal transduction histidine kinase